MSAPRNPPSPSEQTTSTSSLSAWSIASLVLLALAIPLVGIALLVTPLIYGPSAGPAEGAGVEFLLIVSYLAAGACALLGVVSGLVGVRRSSGYTGLSWTGLGFNAVLCIVVFVLALWVFLNP